MTEGLRPIPEPRCQNLGQDALIMLCAHALEAAKGAQ